MRTERVLAGTIVHQEGIDYNRECFTLKLAISTSDIRGRAGGPGPPQPQSCAASLASEVAEGVMEREETGATLTSLSSGVETGASLSPEVAEGVEERVGWIDWL